MNNTKGMNKYKTQNQKSKKIVRPNSASGNSKRNKASFSSQQKSFDYDDNNNNNYNNNYNYEEPKMSMFDEYYKNRMENKNYNYNVNSNNNNYNNINLHNNQNYNNNNNIYLNDNENKIMEQENQINNNNNQNINIDNNNEVNNNKNKIIQRPLTAKNKEIRQKDFLADNKHIISCIQNANYNNKLNKKNSTENPYHKEYGKTPKYLQNMKIEAERKKEIEKLKKETSKYPKGTRLLSEEERLFTLEKLKQSKNDINQIIEKLPITCDSQAFRSKREELFRKLDEIENAIETFSKKKVFVKIENN